MDNNETRSSIVFDELKSVRNRIKLLVDNSGNPIEIFIGNQVYNVLNNLTEEVSVLLKNPNLEATADQFVKMLQEKQ